MSVNTSYSEVRSISDAVFNWGRHSAYDVPHKYREQHENCVFFSLEEAQVGEACKWREQDASGTVRVSSIAPSGCHSLTSTIWYKGRTKSWVDRACLKGNNQWRFNSH